MYMTNWVRSIPLILRSKRYRSFALLVSDVPILPFNIEQAIVVGFTLTDRLDKRLSVKSFALLEASAPLTT
jgi:hypothetical protein